MSGIRYQFDDYNLEQFLSVATSFGQERYGYVVTPNADHLIRLYDDAYFRQMYAEAAYILMDSRFISYFLRCIRGLRVGVCPGSDLTAHLFEQVIQPDDQIVLIGGSSEQAQWLVEQFGLQRLAHHNPPMGFIKRPDEVEECLQFAERHSPFRFCFIAVGSPQQEIVANRLLRSDVARGLGLCVGASLDFLTGVEKRAPTVMQRLGLEWLFRLAQNPSRMAKRYLWRGPRIFFLLPRAEIVMRPATHQL